MHYINPHKKTRPATGRKGGVSFKGDRGNIIQIFLLSSEMKSGVGCEMNVLMHRVRERRHG